jgi:hypothetical protein
VLPPSTAQRWIDAITKVPKAADAVASMARHTGDGTRDLPGAALDAVRRSFPGIDLEAASEDQLAAMGKLFGEELPAGLVFEN